MGEVLDIRDLRVNVEGKEILKGVNLTVEQGEVHALMGPNGSAAIAPTPLTFARSELRRATIAAASSRESAPAT